jgi:hypothetical protein
MKQKGRRTAGVPWAKWHRMIVLRSLKMMVMSGVVRRADLAPPPVHPDSGEGGLDGQGEDQSSAGSMAEPGWLARMFFSREHLLRRHH